MSRNNSEQYDILQKELGVPCREQAWEISYVYALLMKELCEKYGYEREYYTKDASPYKACAYDRSANLCRNHLVAKGLVTQLNQPVTNKVKEVAAQYAVAPKFELKCTTGNYDWDRKPLPSPEKAYKDLTQLKKRELLYVYLNKNLYDIHVYSTIEKYTAATRHNRYSYNSTVEKERTSTTLVIYPKAQRKELIDALCHEKINHFLNERIQLKAKIFFNLELQGEKDSKEPWEGITKYKKDTPITVDEFERRMRLAQEAVSFYQRAYKNLQRQRDRLSTGRTVNVDHEAYKKVLAYFRINAPLYINEVEDKELLHFAKLILMNADNKQIACEWMNPKQQE